MTKEFTKVGNCDKCGKKTELYEFQLSEIRFESAWLCENCIKDILEKERKEKTTNG